MRKNRALPLLVVLALVLAALTYAFAAAVTVPDSTAGEGQARIYGAAATNVHYILVSGNPSKISKVEFTLTLEQTPNNDPDVFASIANDNPIVPATTTWVQSSKCVPAGTTYTCSFAAGSEPSVVAANWLRVTIND